MIVNIVNERKVDVVRPTKRDNNKCSKMKCVSERTRGYERLVVIFS